jgi:tetratricopeptide (TPR) repeat protein
MRLRSLAILLMLAMALTSIPTAWAQQKPFTRDQVQGLVRDGLGDESGAKLIEQRGIDFAPAEDFLQSLQAAGASEAFLNALRAAKQPEPASAKEPLNQVQVLVLLAGQVPIHRVAMLVQERGLDFEPNEDYLADVRVAGGKDELINALKSAKVTKPATVDPVAQARQAEVRQHVTRGGAYLQSKRYADAEAEFRAALRLDPQDPDLHFSLGAALGLEGDWDGMIAEVREDLRLKPNSELAHIALGVALENKGDWDGAATELREALRLNPNSDTAHFGLDRALDQKDDLDGAIAEYREALRLNPSIDGAHVGLGIALGDKGDLDGAIAEYREALRLDPKNGSAHDNLGAALGNKGDWDGAISEYREALRLNPKNGGAHAALGVGLGSKGDWEGAVVEEREALRLNPNLVEAHFNLGFALEKKGDLRGALEEYRAAYLLDPKNATYKRNYERLLQQVNH